MLIVLFHFANHFLVFFEIALHFFDLTGDFPGRGEHSSCPSVRPRDEHKLSLRFSSASSVGSIS